MSSRFDPTNPFDLDALEEALGRMNDFFSKPFAGNYKFHDLPIMRVGRPPHQRGYTPGEAIADAREVAELMLKLARVGVLEHLRPARRHEHPLPPHGLEGVARVIPTPPQYDQAAEEVRKSIASAAGEPGALVIGKGTAQ